MPKTKSVANIDLPSLIEKFGSENKCHAYLEQLRWPDGVVCPRCGCKTISRIHKRRQFDCDSCRYQFSVRVGTVLQESKLPLWKWFLATYMMIQSKKGVSAKQLERMLGVSYKTAWYLCHRIRSAMTQGDEPLRGIIEADETFIGGVVRAKYGESKREVSRRRLENKAIVIGALERGGELRVRVIPNARRPHVHGFLKDTVADNAEAIYSDALRSYRGIGDADTKHEWVDHSAGEWARGDVHTNGIESAWSLFDRAIIGAYHQLSRKHLPAYLDEFVFRFNNRENPYLFRDTLLKVIGADMLPYKKLTADRPHTSSGSYSNSQ
jgi:transposase-like protein